MHKTCYDTALLQSVAHRDNCIIDFGKHQGKLNRLSTIKFVCSCGNNFEKPFRYLNDYGAFCGKCIKLKQREKTKQTFLEKYGVEHVSQSEQIKEKKKQTNLENLGVENPFQSDDIKEKIKQDHLKKHGVHHHSQTEQIKEKKKQTNLKNLGVENPFQSDDIKEKIKQTNIKKYGVENPMQSAEICIKQSKSGFGSKLFTFLSGRKIKVQGYEPIVIQKLIEKGYDETDIITNKNEVPEIWYRDLEGKKHRYYCDIYIPSENKIIEVKSEWTYNKYLHINTLKAETCRTKGYEFEYWVLNKKGERLCY
jgi:hypothetical protein